MGGPVILKCPCVLCAQVIVSVRPAGGVPGPVHGDARAPLRPVPAVGQQPRVLDLHRSLSPLLYVFQRGAAAAAAAAPHQLLQLRRHGARGPRLRRPDHRGHHAEADLPAGVRVAPAARRGQVMAARPFLLLVRRGPGPRAGGDSNLLLVQ